MVITTRSRKSKRPAKKQEKEVITLQDVVEPSDNLMDYCIMIYGESGIGKTSTVGSIPGVYILQCDPKRRGLKVRQTEIPNMSIGALNKGNHGDYTPWERVMKTIDLLVEDNSVECTAIDNFQLFYDAAMRHHCYKGDIDHPNDANDYGATWQKIRGAVTEQAARLLEADKGLVLICHDRVKEHDTGYDKYDRIEPWITGQAFEWVKQATEYVFYLSHGADGDRVVTIRGGEDIWLKCSADETSNHFCDPDGNPIKQFSAGSSPSECWENINAAWRGELRDINYKSKSAKKGRRRRKSTES